MELKQYLKKQVEEINRQPKWTLFREFLKIKKMYIFLFKAFRKWFKKLFKNQVITIFLLIFLLIIFLAVLAVTESILFTVNRIFMLLGYGLFYVVIFMVFLGFVMILGTKFIGMSKARLIRKYKQNGPIRFSDKKYEEAAEILRKFKRIKYKEAVKKFGQEIVDLLIITGTIDFFVYRGINQKTFLEKSVSLKSIQGNNRRDEQSLCK